MVSSEHPYSYSLKQENYNGQKSWIATGRARKPKVVIPFQVQILLPYNRNMSLHKVTQENGPKLVIV